MVRWAITLAVIAAVVVTVIVIQNQGKIDEERLNSAAERLSCTEVEEQDAEQPNEHTEPFATGEGGVPAFGGNHAPGPLPSEPKVYEQQPPEEAAVHSLEHGYVMIYYSTEDENALDPEVVSALEDLANSETEVLMSPYAGLDRPVYFVAWGARQSCDPPEGASAGDLTLVARGFIQEWKNAEFAPEPAVP
ncbi:MAG: DUF3105 domain-containing protein [Actinomycetota bacterium]